MSHHSNSVSALYRSARPVGAPSLTAALDAAEHLGTSHAISSQKASAAAMASANNALNTALYGARPRQQGGYFGHPHTAVYHAYDTAPTDKVALSEGVLQVTAPAADNAAPLAVQSGWQADLLNELSGTTSGSSTTRVQLLQPLQPCAAAVKPSTSYTMYRQEQGLPQVNTTAMLQIQQALEAEQAQQGHAHAQARAISQRVVGSQLAFASQQAPKAPQDPTAPTALYSRHAAYLHPGAGKEGQQVAFMHPGAGAEQRAKPQHASQSAQLVAHLANVAAGKASYVGADMMQLSPEYNPPTAVATAAVHSARMGRMGAATAVHGGMATGTPTRSSGGSSTAATACSSETNVFLDCEESVPGEEVTAMPMPAKRADRSPCPPEPALRYLPDGVQYVYAPHSYTDRATLLDLQLANSIMERIELPGGIQYTPVRSDTMLYKLGTRYGFTAFSITLGSSYFQRLVANMPHLEYAVRQSGPAYAHYLESVPPRSPEHLQMLHAQYSRTYARDGTARHTEESTLWSIQFTCAYLATKVVDRMPMLEMLRYILTHLYKSTVSKAQAYEVESKCLQGLSFRLGPYFKHQQLHDQAWPF